MSAEGIDRTMNRPSQRGRGGAVLPDDPHAITDARAERSPPPHEDSNREDATDEPFGVGGVPIGPPMKGARQEGFQGADRSRDHPDRALEFMLLVQRMKPPEGDQVQRGGEGREVRDAPQPNEIPEPLLRRVPRRGASGSFKRPLAQRRELAVAGDDQVVGWQADGRIGVAAAVDTVEYAFVDLWHGDGDTGIRGACP